VEGISTAKRLIECRRLAFVKRGFLHIGRGLFRELSEAVGGACCNYFPPKPSRVDPAAGAI